MCACAFFVELFFLRRYQNKEMCAKKLVPDEGDHFAKIKASSTKFQVTICKSSASDDEFNEFIKVFDATYDKKLKEGKMFVLIVDCLAMHWLPPHQATAWGDVIQRQHQFSDTYVTGVCICIRPIFAPFVRELFETHFPNKLMLIFDNEEQTMNAARDIVHNKNQNQNPR